MKKTGPEGGPLGSTIEYWDLWDRHRRPLYRTMKRGDPMESGTYHQVVHACIFDREDRLLIQQRQKDKKGWSDRWDVSVGGSAIAGETSQEAIEREVLEELGLSLDFSNDRPIITVHFDRGFDDFFIRVEDDVLDKVTLQVEEVQDARYASLPEILEMIDNGAFVDYEESFIRLLFDFSKKNSIFIEPPRRI